MDCTDNNDDEVDEDYYSVMGLRVFFENEDSVPVILSSIDKLNADGSLIVTLKDTRIPYRAKLEFLSTKTNV